MTESPRIDHEAAGDGAEKTVEEARQGMPTGYMRRVLTISLVLGVLALGGVYFGFVASEHHTPPAPAASTTPPAVASGARDAGTS